MNEDSLFSRLSQDAALTAMVSSRVYPVMAPQGVPSPYVVFNKVVEMQTGTYCASDPMVRDLFDFNSYAKSFKQARAVAKALRDSLVDFRGAMDGIHVAGIWLDTEMQSLDVEPGLFRVSTSLFIWHGD